MFRTPLAGLSLALLGAWLATSPAVAAAPLDSLLQPGARVRVVLPPAFVPGAPTVQHWAGGDRELTGDVVALEDDTLTLSGRGYRSPQEIPISRTRAIYRLSSETHTFGAVRGGVMGGGVAFVLLLGAAFIRTPDSRVVYYPELTLGAGTVIGFVWGATHHVRPWERVR